MNEESMNGVLEEELAPDVRGVLAPTASQLGRILSPTLLTNEALIAQSNVIRTSVALEITQRVIEYYLEDGEPEFSRHELAWKEAIAILGKLAKDAKESGYDEATAMVLEPFEWPAPDILALYGRFLSTFAGKYDEFIRNRFSSSFGSLTPAECLEIVYWVLRPLAPTSSWHYGPWKSPDPKIRGRWHVWPWADYYFSLIKKTYTDMQEVTAPVRPGGSYPWSHG